MSIVSFAVTWKETKGKSAHKISAQIHSLLLSSIHSMTEDTLDSFQTGLSNWIDQFRKIKYLLKLGRDRHVVRCVVSSSIEPQLDPNSESLIVMSFTACKQSDVFNLVCISSIHRGGPCTEPRPSKCTGPPSLDIFKLVKLGPHRRESPSSNMFIMHPIMGASRRLPFDLFRTSNPCVPFLVWKMNRWFILEEKHIVI